MKVFSPDKVQEAMKEKGWSLHELCAHMTVAGLGITYAGARGWITGRFMPRADALGALADVFSQPVDFFFVNVAEEGSHEVIPQLQNDSVLGAVEAESVPGCPEDLGVAPE